MSGIKQIDLTKSVYELCKSYPEIKELLAEIGFKDITKPGMLQTAGRFMTIPKGARMKKIEMQQVIEKFRVHGFNITGSENYE